METEQVIQLLRLGKIGVMPTDTIYGIVGSALNSKVVEEIYKLRKRAKDKPMIILISDLDDLRQFNIKLTDKQKEFLQKNWPSPLSVVLPCSDTRFDYLHRGTNSLAFRMPKKEMLLKIIQRAGPLVAPSANIEGEKPSENIGQASKYFGDKVDFYEDGGEIKSKPSTVIKLKSNALFVVLREGSFKLPVQ